ncbi:MAG: 2,3-bisphosphoglycerate-independent phosphoglycerate mutase, partial [Candidatus Bathyarchaeia archaeon]
GRAVGLEDWKMGNSESGHMNMAAGRIVIQDDLRIDNAFRNGSIRENKVFAEAMHRTRERGSTLHLIALLSKMSSHGSIDYAVSILDIAKERDIRKICVHVIFDGRSTTPGSAPAMLGDLNRELNRIGLGIIASGVGRGYALDRDGNYKDRTRLAYEALVYGKGRPAVLPNHADPDAYVAKTYPDC